MLVEPVADLVAGARTLNKCEPVAAGRVAVLRDDFDDVAVTQFGPQWNHAAVDPRADACVSNFGMDGVGEVDGGAVAGYNDDFALGSKGVDLFRVQVDLERRQELVGVGHVALPLDKLTDPGEPLLVARAHGRAAGLVFPVRGNAFFRDAMHFLGANLDFELVPAFAHHSCVQ